MVKVFTYNEEKDYQRILDAFDETCVITFVEGVCKLPKERLAQWLRRGRQDALEDCDTPLSRLAIEVDFRRAVYGMKLEKKVKSGERNWQGSQWLLERCFRNEFAGDSDLRQYLDILAAKVAEIEKVNAEIQKNPIAKIAPMVIERKQNGY